MSNMIINPMNNTGTPTLHTTLQNYADAKLLRSFKDNLVYHANGVKRVLPMAHGQTIEFWKYVKFDAITDPLQEGVVPEAQIVKQAKITASIQSYGGYIATTDKLEMTMVNYQNKRLVDLMTDQGALSVDTLTRDVMLTTTNVLYSGGKTSRGALTAADCFTTRDIRRAVRILEKAGAPKFSRGGKPYYKAIIGADAKYALMDDPMWVDVSSYQKAENIENGEIGKLFGVIFIETTNNKIYAGEGASGIDVDATLIFGDEAYGVVALGGKGDNVKTIIKPRGSSGVSDPLDQASTIGWKVDGFTTVIQNPDWLIRLESGVAE